MCDSLPKVIGEKKTFEFWGGKDLDGFTEEEDPDRFVFQERENTQEREDYEQTTGYTAS